MSSACSCYRDQTTGKADKRYCLNNQALGHFAEGLFYFKKQDFPNFYRNIKYSIFKNIHFFQ